MTGRLRPEDLTEPERALVAAAAGTRWDVRVRDPQRDDVAASAAWRAERTIRADLLYEHELLTATSPDSLGATEPNPSSPSPVRAVRVRGAKITGSLDLEAATQRCPLQLG
jgi:hypothetical protein